MAGFGILSGLLALPLVGALFIAFALKEDEAGIRNARWVALWTTLVAFILSLFVWSGFDTGKAGFQFVERKEWLGPIVFQLGVDGVEVLHSPR